MLADLCQRTGCSERDIALAFIRHGAGKHDGMDITSAKLDVGSQGLDGFVVIVIILHFTDQGNYFFIHRFVPHLFDFCSSIV